VVQVVLTVEDGDDHLHRFAVRAADSDRPANRYGEEFDEIRELQAHVVATAHRAGIPVVENRQVDTTVRQVLDLILAAASARS